VEAQVKLHSYQLRAIEHLHRTRRAGLFMDMGLGKTATALSALTPEHLPALVVAPKRVAAETWPAERELWRPDLSLQTVLGPPSARRAALRSEADIHVIGRDNLADAREYAGRWRTLIIDELSGYKNRASVRWKQAKVQAQSTPHVWGLTGTPSPNGLMDLWSQVFLLDGGARLGKTLTGFRQRYFVEGRRLPNGVVTRWDPRAESADQIQRLLADLCLSMSADDYLELPEVTINLVPVPLTPDVRRQYERLREQLVLDLRELGLPVFTARNSAALTNRLTQITAGFLYPDRDDPTAPADLPPTRLHSLKTEALQAIIEETGSPVLVFYRYKEELAELQRAIPGLHTIDEPNIIARWNSGDVPVLAAHPASAGHGLNLQHGGHTVCWTTVPWSLEEWQQANGRLARQGQTRPVIVHVLACPGTVDVEIARRLRTKESVQDTLMAYLGDVL
jgi:SNF2 family DNA or RNA helicase